MPKEFLISFNFCQGRDGKFAFQCHIECDTLEDALIHFLNLKMKYSTVSLDYRKR